VAGRTVLTVLALSAAAAADEAKPLPLRASVILPSGGHHFVEGEQEIRWGQELSVQKETVIRGRGAGAVLKVHGALQVRGVTGNRVVFEDLVIEVAERCERVHLDHAVLRRCTVRTPKDVACEARVHVESCLLEESPIDLRLKKGEVTILGSDLRGAFTLMGVEVKEGQRKPPPVQLLLNGSNLNRDLLIELCKDVEIRANSIVSPKCVMKNCYELDFDGNVLKGPGVLIEQTDPGRLKKTEVMKCDFHGTVLTLKAPRDGRRKDRVPVDKCWFNGRTKKSEILGRDIRDGSVDEQNGAYAVLRKVNDRPLELGGMSLDPNK